MHEELQKLIEQGVVEESRSEWNNPVVMVKKHSGEPRMCIDFRKVNEVSRKDSYPTPHMDTILNKLKKARYITTIDLKSAYHNIPLSEESKEVTAFTIPGKGLFQYKTSIRFVHSWSHLSEAH